LGSIVAVMTMDMNSDLNGAPLSPGNVVPCATEIGREFVRQYYTLLSERPQDVHRFYSHESVFIHGGVEAIGQQKIERAIDSLGFDECKVRIHTIKGSHTLAQGIALQVCGEMQENERCEPRYFIQTIVLCQQTPKKFFVQNNIFQFYDSCFNIPESAKPAPQVEPEIQKINTIPSPKANGIGSSPTVEKIVKAQSDNSVKKERENKSPRVEKREEPSKTPASDPEPPVVQAAVPVETKDDIPPIEAPVPPAPAPMSVREQPKSWARMVGGGGGNASVSPGSPPKSFPPRRRAFQEKNEVKHVNGQRDDKKHVYRRPYNKEAKEGKSKPPVAK
ncbi:hypothetical protein PMAYCL1PPCAC_11954, partial [Pristionchus mayeri]